MISLLLQIRTGTSSTKPKTSDLSQTSESPSMTPHLKTITTQVASHLTPSGDSILQNIEAMGGSSATDVHFNAHIHRVYTNNKVTHGSEYVTLFWKYAFE